MMARVLNGFLHGARLVLKLNTIPVSVELRQNQHHFLKGQGVLLVRVLLAERRHLLLRLRNLLFPRFGSNVAMLVLIQV